MLWYMAKESGCCAVTVRGACIYRHDPGIVLIRNITLASLTSMAAQLELQEPSEGGA